MIIVDNTVLSALAHVDKLDILSNLFGATIVPESVYYEGVVKARESGRVAKIKRSIEKGSIKVVKPTESESNAAVRLPKTLGLGERYTIALGSTKRCLIATDDLKPRRVAEELGLDTIGTLGILRLACKRHVLEKEELQKLVSTLHEILYFSEELEKWVLSDEEV